MARLYNPTDAPVSIDEGVVVGGREHADAPLSKLVRRHLDAGRLLETKKPAVKATVKKEGA